MSAEPGYGLEAFAARCAGMGVPALEREGATLAKVFESFLPVAVVAISFRNAGAELWAPADVWAERFGEFERHLAFAEKHCTGKDAAAFVAELKSRGEALKWYRNHAEKVCDGSFGTYTAQQTGMMAWYQANVQKQAWNVWGRISRIMEHFTMRAALLEGVRTGKMTMEERTAEAEHRAEEAEDMRREGWRGTQRILALANSSHTIMQTLLVHDPAKTQAENAAQLGISQQSYNERLAAAERGWARLHPDAPPLCLRGGHVKGPRRVREIRDGDGATQPVYPDSL